MCLPGYLQNDFVATQVLGHVMNGYVPNRTSCAQVHELPQSHVLIAGRAHCFHDCIYYAQQAFVRFDLCAVDHLWPIIYDIYLICIYIIYKIYNVYLIFIYMHVYMYIMYIYMSIYVCMYAFCIINICAVYFCFFFVIA